MCDFQNRLVAWLDHELPEAEAAEVERHVAGCAECRKWLAAYDRASAEFSTYCDAVAASGMPRKSSRARSVALAAGAIAAAIALLLFARSRAHEPTNWPQGRSAAPRELPAPPALTQVPLSNPPQASAIKRAGVARMHHRTITAAVPAQRASLIPPGPTVQVMIPADAVLPPGAAPAGTNFVVDFSVAPDGSAQAIRVRPELVGFERRANQP